MVTLRFSPPGLVQQDHLVDVRGFELEQLPADDLGRTHQPGAALLLTLGRLLPFEVLLPQIHPARRDHALGRVEAQRELEEGPAVGLAQRLLVRLAAHEARDQRDIRIRLVYQLNIKYIVARRIRKWL